VVSLGALHNISILIRLSRKALELNTTMKMKATGHFANAAMVAVAEDIG
jgi:hypothetical protein